MKKLYKVNKYRDGKKALQKYFSFKSVCDQRLDLEESTGERIKKTIIITKNFRHEYTGTNCNRTGLKLQLHGQ